MPLPPQPRPSRRHPPHPAPLDLFEEQAHPPSAAARRDEAVGSVDLAYDMEHPPETHQAMRKRQAVSFHGDESMDEILPKRKKIRRDEDLTSEPISDGGSSPSHAAKGTDTGSFSSAAQGPLGDARGEDARPVYAGKDDEGLVHVEGGDDEGLEGLVDYQGLDDYEGGGVEGLVDYQGLDEQEGRDEEEVVEKNGKERFYLNLGHYLEAKLTRSP